jgi:phosphoglycolate phosphatase-like HAD superfamily hydrolase
MIVRILDAAGTAPDRALMIGNSAADRRTARRMGVRYEEASVFFGRAPRIAGTVKRVVQKVTPV